MTEEQVVLVLGTGNKPLLTGGVVGGISFSLMQYDNHGFTVIFTDGRVHLVTFSPFFD
jgi:hypothetical protein